MQPNATATPAGMQPATNGTGYTSAGYNPYAPLGFFSTTQGPPTAGINGFQNSVQVNRVWAEYNTPVGQLRFGRMGSQWGLGMVANSGDGIDSDYQSTIDRVMFISGVPPVDLFFGLAYDFVDSGTNNSNPYTIYGGEPYSNASYTNVGEFVFFAAHRVGAEKARGILERGGLVLNGGFYGVYREQKLDVQNGQTPYTDNTACNTSTCNNGLQFRGASAFIPDLWVQLLWNKLRVEGEFAAIVGQNRPDAQPGAGPHARARVRPRHAERIQDAAGQAAPRLRLRLGERRPLGRVAQPGAQWPAGRSERQRAHLDVPIPPRLPRRLDLLPGILTRVEGAYYFRPSVDYDFIRQPNGQKFGGAARSSGAARASSRRRRGTSETSGWSSISSSITRRATGS